MNAVPAVSRHRVAGQKSVATRPPSFGSPRSKVLTVPCRPDQNQNGWSHGPWVELGRGRHVLLLDSWPGARRCIPVITFGRGGPPDRSGFPTPVDQTAAANVVGHVYPVLGRGAGRFRRNDSGHALLSALSVRELIANRADFQIGNLTRARDYFMESSRWKRAACWRKFHGPAAWEICCGPFRTTGPHTRFRLRMSGNRFGMKCGASNGASHRKCRRSAMFDSLACNCLKERAEFTQGLPAAPSPHSQ